MLRLITKPGMPGVFKIENYDLKFVEWNLKAADSELRRAFT
jgi:hypothetical protein